MVLCDFFVEYIEGAIVMTGQRIITSIITNNVLWIHLLSSPPRPLTQD